jgi:glycosyltransferase involved in cell wall biosynthesis
MNIIIASSRERKNNLFFDLLQELSVPGNNFSYWAKKQALGAEVAGKFFYAGPTLNSRLKLFVFAVQYPFLSAYYFFRIIVFKYRFGLEAIVTEELNEKLIITPLALILGIKIFWLEDFSDSRRKKSKFVNFLSRRVKIITFFPSVRNRLINSGLAPENVFLVRPGIKLSSFTRQENIFSDIAKVEREKAHRKYYTLGAVTDYRDSNQVENLLKAAKICLEVIPNLQLVILGDGEGRKKMAWASKKLEVENFVWFVGRQDNLRKWLDSFDVYIAEGEDADELDAKILLKAMSAGLPIIAPAKGFYPDFIINGQNGSLSEIGGSEALSREIIKLYRQQVMAYRLGDNARKEVVANYDLNNQAQKLSEIFKSNKKYI